MATQVQIANLALQRLGCERINSLSDNNKRAKLITDLYDIVRDNVLSSYPWSFATKELTLNKISDSTGNVPFKYQIEMNLPSDHVRIQKEYNDLIYKVIGKKIQTDEETLQLTYTSNNVSEDEFSADFVKVFYLSLAMDSSHSLTQDKGLTAQLQAEIELVLGDTRFNDSKESSAEEFEIDSYLNVRL